MDFWTSITTIHEWFPLWSVKQQVIFAAGMIGSFVMIAYGAWMVYQGVRDAIRQRRELRKQQPR